MKSIVQIRPLVLLAGVFCAACSFTVGTARVAKDDQAVTPPTPPLPDIPQPLSVGPCETTDGLEPRSAVVFQRYGRAPILLIGIDPSFPDGARSRCVSGFSLLRITVDDFGAFEVHLVASEPEPAFGAVSLDAARTFSFEPGYPGTLTAAFLFWFAQPDR